jgi:hypothetical protein
VQREGARHAGPDPLRAAMEGPASRLPTPSRVRPRGPRRLVAAGLGYLLTMPLGTSIFLIALGAILRYAVTATVSGLSLPTIGLILMIVGIAGVILALLYMLTWAPRRGAMRERVVERDPYREPPAV